MITTCIYSDFNGMHTRSYMMHYYPTVSFIGGVIFLSGIQLGVVVAIGLVSVFKCVEDASD
jgi:hypothetical protein